VESRTKTAGEGAARRRAKLHVAVAVLAGVVLPGGSLLAGEGVFAWTMFSKSETYRMTVVGTTLEGARRSFDPRDLVPHVNGTLAYFLPSGDRYRHDPVGLTFRTGLGKLAELACKMAPLRSIEITLEERKDLDAMPRVTVAHAECR
jgi:hypothetical protein